MNVRHNEDGSIEIDNTELLRHRADITMDKRKGNLPENDDNKHDELHTNSDLGGIMEHGGEEEKALKSDKRRFNWSEPSHKLTDVLHVCPICSTRYYGRPNKAYCSTNCREVAKKRRQRQHKRELRDFKPYRGKTGEVYFMCQDEKTIAFVPAINAESRVKAKKYLDDTFPKSNYFEQVKEVIRK